MANYSNPFPESGGQDKKKKIIFGVLALIIVIGGLLGLLFGLEVIGGAQADDVQKKSVVVVDTSDSLSGDGIVIPVDTYSPTTSPTSPTLSPTQQPSFSPTSRAPTTSPTPSPSSSPTLNNSTLRPTGATLNPTKSPSMAPTTSPTSAPTATCSSTQAAVPMPDGTTPCLEKCTIGRELELHKQFPVKTTCQFIEGSVDLSESSGNVEFPNVKYIRGRIHAAGSYLKTISFPACEYVGGIFLAANDNAGDEIDELVSVSMPELQVIGNNLLIDSWPMLATVDFTSLETVGKDAENQPVFVLKNNANLENGTFSSLLPFEDQKWLDYEVEKNKCDLVTTAALSGGGGRRMETEQSMGYQCVLENSVSGLQAVTVLWLAPLVALLLR